MMQDEKKTWKECKHYFIKSNGDHDNTDGYEDVVCVYCSCCNYPSNKMKSAEEWVKQTTQNIEQIIHPTDRWGGCLMTEADIHSLVCRVQNDAIASRQAVYCVPEGFCLVPVPLEGSLHEAAADAIMAFYEAERPDTVKRLEGHGLSFKAFGAFLMAFVNNSKKYIPVKKAQGGV